MSPEFQKWKNELCTGRNKWQTIGLEGCWKLENFINGFFLSRQGDYLSRMMKVPVGFFPLRMPGYIQNLNGTLRNADMEGEKTFSSPISLVFKYLLKKWY